VNTLRKGDDDDDDDDDDNNNDDNIRVSQFLRTRLKMKGRQFNFLKTSRQKSITSAYTKQTVYISFS
jgi:hypothetical protein